MKLAKLQSQWKERRKAVLHDWLMTDMSLADIGKKYRITRARVKQIVDYETKRGQYERLGKAAS